MLREKLGLSSSAEMDKIGGATFAYLFHRIDQDQLVRVVRAHDESKVERILEVVRRDGYVLKHCKLYAWAFFKSRHGFPKPKPNDFLIVRDDPKFMRRYREEPEFVKGLKEDAAFLRRLNLANIDLKYEALSLEDYDVLIEGATTSPSIEEYIGKFISKSMTFLLRSYGVKRDELAHDMQAAAVRAIYMKYPVFESALHLTNTAKTTIGNTGKTLITYHVSPSRQRLMLNSEGKFEARNVNTEVLTDLEAPPSYLDHVKDYLEVLAKLSDRMRPDVQRFLLCCAGHYDQEFSQFLGLNNSEAIEDMAYSRYMGKARKHFKYSENQVTKLFAKLRLHME
jgi:hypothetical protein